MSYNRIVINETLSCRVSEDRMRELYKWLDKNAYDWVDTKVYIDKYPDLVVQFDGTFDDGTNSGAVSHCKQTEKAAKEYAKQKRTR